MYHAQPPSVSIQALPPARQGVVEDDNGVAGNAGGAEGGAGFVWEVRRRDGATMGHQNPKTGRRLASKKWVISYKMMVLGGQW